MSKRIVIYNKNTNELVNILDPDPFLYDEDNLYHHLLKKDLRAILGVELDKNESKALLANKTKIIRNHLDGKYNFVVSGNNIQKIVYNNEIIKNNDFVISGYITSSAGYSRLTRLFIDKCIEYKYNIKLMNHSNEEYKKCIGNVYDKYWVNIEDYYKKTNYSVISFAPPHIRFPRKILNMTYTMLEGYSVNSSYKKVMDSAWDMFLVPTQFVKDLFCTFINEDRVKLLPIGLNLNAFNVNIEKNQDIKFKKYDSETNKFIETDEKPSGFRFLNVSRFSHRKGSDLLVKSYIKHFDKSHDVSLVMFSLPENEVSTGFVETSIINILNKNKKGYVPNIFLINTPWDEDKQTLPYSWGDAFVLPSRGEGFGIPPLEAASCGLPLICSRVSGMCDYISEDTAMVIEPDYFEEIGTFSDQNGYVGRCPAWRHDAFFPHLFNTKFPVMDSAKIINDIGEKMLYVYNNNTSNDILTKKEKMFKLIENKYNITENFRDIDLFLKTLF